MKEQILFLKSQAQERRVAKMKGAGLLIHAISCELKSVR